MNFPLKCCTNSSMVKSLPRSIIRIHESHIKNAQVFSFFFFFLIFKAYTLFTINSIFIYELKK